MWIGVGNLELCSMEGNDTLSASIKKCRQIWALKQAGIKCGFPSWLGLFAPCSVKATGCLPRDVGRWNSYGRWTLLECSIEYNSNRRGLHVISDNGRKVRHCSSGRAWLLQAGRQWLHSLPLGKCFIISSENWKRTFHNYHFLLASSY